MLAGGLGTDFAKVNDCNFAHRKAEILAIGSGLAGITLSANRSLTALLRRQQLWRNKSLGSCSSTAEILRHLHTFVRHGHSSAPPTTERRIARGPCLA
jgi:hypothetical protein